MQAKYELLKKKITNGDVMYAATVLAVNFSVSDSVIHLENNLFTSTELAIFYTLFTTYQS